MRLFNLVRMVMLRAAPRPTLTVRPRLEALESRYAPAVGAIGALANLDSYLASTPYLKSTPSVATDAKGDAVAVWSALGEDGDGWGVYGEYFDPSGNPVGHEFRVNDTISGNQEYATVAMDPYGGFVVTWSSNSSNDLNWKVFAKIYDSSGKAKGSEFLVGSILTGGPTYASVVMDASGGFSITWPSNSLNPWSVLTQNYSAAGVPLGAPLTTTLYAGTSGDVGTVTPTTDTFAVSGPGVTLDGSEILFTNLDNQAPLNLLMPLEKFDFARLDSTFSTLASSEEALNLAVPAGESVSTATPFGADTSSQPALDSFFASEGQLGASEDSLGVDGFHASTALSADLASLTPWAEGRVATLEGGEESLGEA
jgi:hypothetical protein